MESLLCLRASSSGGAGVPLSRRRELGALADASPTLRQSPQKDKTFMPPSLRFAQKEKGTVKFTCVEEVLRLGRRGRKARALVSSLETRLLLASYPGQSPAKKVWVLGTRLGSSIRKYALRQLINFTRTYLRS